MTAPPPGLSCANCDFFEPSARECRRNPPASGGGPSWPNTDPEDWCSHHNFWPGVGAPKHTWGQPQPSGGDPGDYYTQYTVIKSGTNNYVSQIVFWANQDGVWIQIATISDPWP